VLPPYLSPGIQDGIKYDGREDEIARIEACKAGLADRLRTLDALTPLRFNKMADFDASGRLKPDSQGYSPFIRTRP